MSAPFTFVSFEPRPLSEYREQLFTFCSLHALSVEQFVAVNCPSEQNDYIFVKFLFPHQGNNRIFEGLVEQHQVALTLPQIHLKAENTPALTIFHSEDNRPLPPPSRSHVFYLLTGSRNFCTETALEISANDSVWLSEFGSDYNGEDCAFIFPLRDFARNHEDIFQCLTQYSELKTSAYTSPTGQRIDFSPKKIILADTQSSFNRLPKMAKDFILDNVRDLQRFKE